MRIEGPDNEPLSHVTFKFTHEDADEALIVFRQVIEGLEELRDSLQGVGTVVIASDDNAIDRAPT